MKRRKIILGWMITLFILLVGSISTQAASSKWNTACEAYKNFLIKNQSHYVPNEGRYWYNYSNTESGNTINSFIVADLDRNGIPELIAAHRNAMKEHTIYVYTCINGKVVNVKDSKGQNVRISARSYTGMGNNSVYVCNQNHMHVTESWGTGSHVSTYKLQNGKLIYYAECQWNNIIAKMITKINGKNVSQKIYNSTINCRLKTCWIDNNMTNRNRIPFEKVTPSKKKDSNARINVTSGKLCIGKTVKLKVSRNDSKVKWSTSNRKVATVSSKGVVTGKKAGKAVITATVGKRKLKCTVVVQPTLSISTKSISVNKTGKVAVTVNDSSPASFVIGNSKYISARWERISSGKLNLVITGKKKGSTYVKVVNRKSKESIKIKVKIVAVQSQASYVKSVAVSNVTLNRNSLSLTQGGVFNLTVAVSPSNATNKSVTWSSSNSSVAAVSGGKVTARKAGTATITAKANNGKYASCTVTVKNPTPVYTPYIRLNKRVSSGSSSGKIDVSTYPNIATVNWSSSNSNVVSVDSFGNVTARGKGTATITASMWVNGKRYFQSMNLTVGSRANYGTWSNWTTDAISENTYTQVDTATVYRYYCFYCPVCGGREPYQGRSDCHKYTLTLSDARATWSTIPYYRSNPKSYRYTTAKYYTDSLGDGQRWNFSAGNLNHTSIGTLDAAGPAAVVITRGYRSRSVSYTNYFM